MTKFQMNLFAGKRSLIENSENLCKTDRRASPPRTDWCR